MQEGRYTKRTTVDFSFISWNPPGGLKSFDVTGTVTLGRAVPREKCWSCAFPCTHPPLSRVTYFLSFRFVLFENKRPFSLNATNVNTITTLCRSCHVCIVVSYLLHHRQRAFFQKGNFSTLLSATQRLFTRERVSRFSSLTPMYAYLIVAKLYIIRCNNKIYAKAILIENENKLSEN